MTRQARSDNTRERVLDAALALFDETSSVEVPVKLLGERSGVSVGSIYHHFGSVSGVAAALYSHCMGALLDHLLESIAGAERLEAVIEKIVRSYLVWTKRNAVKARFIHASAFAPFIGEYHTEIEKEKSGRMERLAAVVHAHVDTGRVKELPLFVHEVLIIGPVAEAARRWLSGGSDADLALAVKHLPTQIRDLIRRVR
jgi:AcrR family transcriptional regulator